MNIELTPELQQAVDCANGTPAEVIDPRTQTKYLLVKADVYASLTPAPLPPPVVSEGLPCPEMAPGVRRSKRALRKDLPELLANRRNRGKFVCYHLEERIGIDKDDLTLIRLINKLNIPDDEYIIDTIEEGAGNEEELDL